MNLFRPINILLVASLGIHLWASHALDPGAGYDVETMYKDQDIIELTPLPERELEDKDIHGQVVETPSLPETEAPEDYDYVSEKNIKVAFQRKGPLDRQGSKLVPPPSMIMEIEEMGEDSSIKVISRKTLFPSYKDLKDWLADEPGRIDHLEDIPFGEITQVNTHAYKYALFFNQLKRTLYFYWNPRAALLLSGSPARDLETRLLVRIEKNGVLRSVEVVKSCGYLRVDQAAVGAFQQATPIYNIPDGLCNSEGYLEMLWAFHIVY
jgi:TonB family protein